MDSEDGEAEGHSLDSGSYSPVPDVRALYVFVVALGVRSRGFCSSECSFSESSTSMSTNSRSDESESDRNREASLSRFALGLLMVEQWRLEEVRCLQRYHIVGSGQITQMRSEIGDSKYLFRDGCDRDVLLLSLSAVSDRHRLRCCRFASRETGWSILSMMKDE